VQYMGIRQDLTPTFYSKRNILGVLGDKEYRAARKEESDETDIMALRAALQDRPSIEEIIKLIGQLTQMKKSELITRKHGRQGQSPNRAFAMYACHHYCQATHKEIAHYFGLKQAGSVCYPLAKVKKEIGEGGWGRLAREIEVRIL